jgi:hypothetical protein
MSANRTFWAWHRRGLASGIRGVPASGARAQLPAQVTLDAHHSRAVPVDLMGPGDVVGLEPAQVLRCEPADATAHFPPSEFPYIELRDADLPWRFSPVGPDTRPVLDPEHPHDAVEQPQSRLQPWIALVVLPAEAAGVTGDPTSRTVLTCRAELLPRVDDAWAWAHVQLTSWVGGGAEALDDPQQSFARLLCPVRLEADQRYVAAVVPTFAAGVEAAGLPTGKRHGLDAAWAASGEAVLPVYHWWSFTTSAAGTFESLARLLRPHSAPTAAAGIPVRVDAAGWGLQAPTGRTVLVQGALRPLGPPGGDPPGDPEVATSLAEAVSATAGSLELRPPLYGQDHAGYATAVATHATGWFSQLNTDVRRRFAAGLGGWAVAVDQEDLSDEAWQQLAAAGVPSGAGPTAMASAVLGALTARHGVAAEPIGQASLRTPASAATVSSSSVLHRLLRSGGPLTRVGLAGANPAAVGAFPVGAVQVRRSRSEVALRRPPVATATPALAARLGAAGSAAGRLSAAGSLTAPSSPATPAATAAGLFCPSFADDGLQRLQSTAPEWLLPGMDDLPDNAVVLLRTNPAFVEAFLVGLNHALARELQWRSYPLDTFGTMFTRFWPAVPGSPGEVMQPMAAWRPESELGSHLDGEDAVVLLVRGALLRRFPTTTIYLSGEDGSGTETVVRPSIEAYAGTDATLVGFPVGADELTNPGGGRQWSVVLQESVEHTRFGADDPPADGTTAKLRTWQDLDWSNPHLNGATHVPVDGPLKGRSRPSAPASEVAQPPTVRWGTDSSAMATALTRAPVRVRIPAALWLATQA